MNQTFLGRRREGAQRGGVVSGHDERGDIGGRRRSIRMVLFAFLVVVVNLEFSERSMSDGGPGARRANKLSQRATSSV